MFVYFIQLGEKPDGLIKIGRAKDPQHRMKELQTGTPFKLRLIHVVECKSLEHSKHMEEYFHRTFSRFRRRGEWFALAKELKRLGIIGKVNQNKREEYIEALT